MQREANSRAPVVLAIGGHDPSGGAGIQADIETIHVLGGQPVTLITSLTAQNTQRFERCIAVSPEQFREQAELLLEDIDVQAIKIGLVPTPGLADVIGSLLQERASVKVVCDPVLVSGTGTATADTATVDALRRLLPLVTVATPNSEEARRLSGEGDLEVAAGRLLELGCKHVLVTGTHEDTPTVANTLYSVTRRMTWTWERLPHVYHGSGCTLASALATLLAHGLEVDSAATLAQEYVWRTLKNGYPLGRGQYHPSRLRYTDAASR